MRACVRSPESHHFEGSGRKIARDQGGLHYKTSSKKTNKQQQKNRGKMCFMISLQASAFYSPSPLIPASSLSFLLKIEVGTSKSSPLLCPLLPQDYQLNEPRSPSLSPRVQGGSESILWPVLRVSPRAGVGTLGGEWPWKGGLEMFGNLKGRGWEHSWKLCKVWVPWRMLPAPPPTHTLSKFRGTLCLPQ